MPSKKDLPEEARATRQSSPSRTNYLLEDILAELEGVNNNLELIRDEIADLKPKKR